MIGYKVVVNDGDDRRWSAIVHDVEYFPQAIVYPPEGWGPLAVFDSVDAAYWFRSSASEEIWRVEYEPSKARSLWQRHGMKNRITKRLSRDFPYGTKFAKSVRLLERIW